MENNLEISNQKDDENGDINEDYAGNAAPISKEQTKKILSQLENHICKIYEIEGKKATGFFCKIPFPDQFNLLPVLFTNNHVLGEKDLEINKTIKITLDDDKIEKYLKLDSSRLVYTSKELDVSIIQIKAEDHIDKFLDIDDNIFEDDYLQIYKKETPIYIIQYPKGQNSSHSVGIIKEIYTVNPGVVRRTSSSVTPKFFKIWRRPSDIVIRHPKIFIVLLLKFRLSL